MKTFLKTAGLLLCVAMIASCKKSEVTDVPDAAIINPLSDYTITPDPNDGFTFKFNTLAEKYVKQEWRFGDDTLKTDDNPTHTYLAPGIYTVDLRTISKTGDISHKYVDIHIAADSVLQATAVKTGVANQLKFGLKLKGNIASAEWTFNAVDAATSSITTTKSTDLNPLVSFTYGSFNNFSVTVTTDKGSVVTISKSATTDGIVSDITLTNIGFSSTYENSDNNENSLKLVDGNTQTKFGYYGAFPGDENIVLQFKIPQTVKVYAIENGNDNESLRDPKEWYIEGSNDNQNWEQLDHQLLTIGFADYLTSIGQNSTRYFRFFYYPIANPKPFLYYRWRITSTFAGQFQIMEFKLYK